MPVASAFEVLGSRSHGPVQAVSLAMQRLGFAALIASKPSRERDLICALVAARIIAPQTKLATTRWWHTSTLAEHFRVVDATEDVLYAAMDWLLAGQSRIQKKLAAHVGQRCGEAYSYLHVSPPLLWGPAQALAWRVEPP